MCFKITHFQLALATYIRTSKSTLLVSYAASEQEVCWWGKLRAVVELCSAEPRRLACTVCNGYTWLNRLNSEQCGCFRQKSAQLMSVAFPTFQVGTSWRFDGDERTKGWKKNKSVMIITTTRIMTMYHEYKNHKSLQSLSIRMPSAFSRKICASGSQAENWRGQGVVSLKGGG